MKRGMAGRTRRGSPPLKRQRAALRVVQVTLLALGLTLALFALRALDHARRPPADPVGPAARAGLGEVAGLSAGAVLALGGALAMGVRIVRGPEPPTLD